MCLVTPLVMLLSHILVYLVIQQNGVRQSTILLYSSCKFSTDVKSSEYRFKIY